MDTILLILQTQSSARPVSRFVDDIKFVYIFMYTKLLVTRALYAQHSTNLVASCGATATTAASALISLAAAASSVFPLVLFRLPCRLDRLFGRGFGLELGKMDAQRFRSAVIQLRCKVKLFLQHIIRMTQHQNCRCFSFSQQCRLLSCSALN